MRGGVWITKSAKERERGRGRRAGLNPRAERAKPRWGGGASPCALYAQPAGLCPFSPTASASGGGGVARSLSRWERVRVRACVGESQGEGQTCDAPRSCIAGAISAPAKRQPAGLCTFSPAASAPGGGAFGSRNPRKSAKDAKGGGAARSLSRWERVRACVGESQGEGQTCDAPRRSVAGAIPAPAKRQPAGLCPRSPTALASGEGKPASPMSQRATCTSPAQT